MVYCFLLLFVCLVQLQADHFHVVCSTLLILISLITIYPRISLILMQIDLLSINPCQFAFVVLVIITQLHVKQNVNLPGLLNLIMLGLLSFSIFILEMLSIFRLVLLLPCYLPPRFDDFENTFHLHTSVCSYKKTLPLLTIIHIIIIQILIF